MKVFVCYLTVQFTLPSEHLAQKPVVPFLSFPQQGVLTRRESDSVNNVIEENQPTLVEFSFVRQHSRYQAVRVVRTFTASMSPDGEKDKLTENHFCQTSFHKGTNESASVTTKYEQEGGKHQSEFELSQQSCSVDDRLEWTCRLINLPHGSQDLSTGQGNKCTSHSKFLREVKLF